MQSFGIRAAWETQRQARGGGGGRSKRRGRGRGSEGPRGGRTGQGGIWLPALSWTVDVVTAQGVPSLVEVPRPVIEPPEFLAQVTPEYAREMAAAMMGLEQLVREYAIPRWY